MIRSRPVALVAGFAIALAGCGGGGGKAKPAPLTGWAAMRAAAAPTCALPLEFQAPRVQSIAVDGWEDGIAISRDGLDLYAVYAPADLLSFTTAGADQHHAADYLRGPTLGMDLTTAPVPGYTTWLHGNIIHASRATTAVHFGPWQLAAMARPVWSEGAPQVTDDKGGGLLLAYTTNEHAPDYAAHIAIARHAARDPAALGALLPGPVTTPDPPNAAIAGTNEDNPHIERLGTSDNLVLFFDSADRPGGLGQHDIWYATSADDGASWTTPALVTTIDTSADEHQPHLWKDPLSGLWWLYFTATNSTDGKLGIFRAVQATPGNWDSWGRPELVVGAGNTAGVGEPTLTAAGDLSFVVVLEDTVHGTPTNRFDADPWFMPRIPSAVVALPASGGALARRR
jgi:hypothetical protein